jgi:hypothetical protein
LFLGGGGAAPPPRPDGAAGAGADSSSGRNTPTIDDITTYTAQYPTAVNLCLYTRSCTTQRHSDNSTLD